MDITEQLVQLLRDLNISFHHIKRSANEEADKLAKEEVIKHALTDLFNVPSL